MTEESNKNNKGIIAPLEVPIIPVDEYAIMATLEKMNEKIVNICVAVMALKEIWELKESASKANHEAINAKLDLLISGNNPFNSGLVSFMKEVTEQIRIIHVKNADINAKLDSIINALIPSPELPNTNGITNRDLPDLSKIRLR